jgi:hypothetical protein
MSCGIGLGFCGVWESGVLADEGSEACGLWLREQAFMRRRAGRCSRRCFRVCSPCVLPMVCGLRSWYGLGGV